MRIDLEPTTYNYGTGEYTLEPNNFFNKVLDTLYSSVQYVYGFDIIGEIAEFGTMTGKTAGLLAHAIQISNKQFKKNLTLAGLNNKKLHLFDSFEGLPCTKGSPVDLTSPHVQSKIWKEGACKGMSAQEMDSFIGAILPSDQFSIFEGWFSKSLVTIPPTTKYSLIHIDCDLYVSSIAVLNHLFSNKMISEGAMILFDDWNCNRASNLFGERKAWHECLEKYSIEYSDEGSYGFVSHKFIIHNYKQPLA